ncbi:hypothetical protein ABVK25_011698 [Lepraria finkii]|uniref:Uncharacterized protein n=1 Tax=Lepraria finkii TaxID=1340010 RepID=A0ABR4ALJ0_9LECA
MLFPVHAGFQMPTPPSASGIEPVPISCVASAPRIAVRETPPIFSQVFGLAAPIFRGLFPAFGRIDSKLESFLRNFLDRSIASIARLHCRIRQESAPPNATTT